MPAQGGKDYVSARSQQLLFENICFVARALPGTFPGQSHGPNVGDVEMDATRIVQGLEKEKEPGRNEATARRWDRWCQLPTSVPVLMTHWLQKHWEWQEDRRKNVWHGSERRPTVYVVSMDIKTAFDVARPTHIANIWRAPNHSGQNDYLPFFSLRDHFEYGNKLPVPVFFRRSSCIR